MLPPELWQITGEFIFVDIAPFEDSLLLKIKPATCYAIIYPSDEGGEWFVEPCQIS